MKATYIEREGAREIGARHAVRRGKAAIPRGAGAAFEADGDRQIDEIERTFTLRYEW